MQRRCFLILAILLASFLALPIDSFSKGKSGSGTSSSYRGGKYTGGSGSRKGSHYSNPKTGDRYQKKGTGSYSPKTSSKSKSELSPKAIGKGKSESTQKHLARAKGGPSVKNSAPSNLDKSVKRDSKGRIVRSESAKEAFLKSRGLAKVPKGYEVDHVTPLYAGGKDDPSNMQLLTKEEHRVKTKQDYKRYGK